MKKLSLLLGLLAAIVAPTFAQEGAVPKGIPHLDHVFVIMMENHGYKELLNNPNAKFINSYAKSANLATNYFAVAHPSFTNYLEAVGGSNFGILSDNAPDWHSHSCQTNLETGIPNTDNPPSPNVCPIRGTGTDAATPALDCSNEVTGPPCEINIDGKMSYPAVSTTLGITIADQLATAGLTWKSYQESLPMSGPNKVNYSDGNFTNLTDFSKIKPVLDPPLTSGDIVQLYAVKHNPFAYFQNVQQGNNPLVSYAQMAAFDGAEGCGLTWPPATLRISHSSRPTSATISTAAATEPLSATSIRMTMESRSGLNPALIIMGDQVVEKIVNAIHNSPIWNRGHNAIVFTWDENDYAVQPIINQVVTVVDTNYGFHGVQSSQFYVSFSLLRSLEGGFGLPCLNHACDSSTAAMTDLFGAQ